MAMLLLVRAVVVRAVLVLPLVRAALGEGAMVLPPLWTLPCEMGRLWQTVLCGMGRFATACMRL